MPQPTIPPCEGKRDTMTSASDTARLVYQAVRSHLKAGDRPTITDISHEIGISTSTAHRAAKAYGYLGWSDMVNRLRHYYRRAEQIEHQDDQDPNGIDLLAEALVRHRGGRVLVLGIGDVEICQKLLIYRLGELGFAVMPYAYEIARACQRQAGSESSGLALFCNESGLVCWQAALECNQCGFETVAITASSRTPVARAANLAIAIKSTKSEREAYQPNLFAAGSLALVEHAIARYHLLCEAHDSR